MAVQSLYRRYRPRRFDELKGQEHVVRALRNAVINHREGQAAAFAIHAAPSIAVIRTTF
jgi:DNA polymerase-3 subunit gamma/tau